jgi:Xaa-Pro aminopeptidase
METMQPALRNGRNVWDQINMPASEFKGRVRAVREGMQKEGLDVFLAYGHAYNEYGNPCYLSNYIIRLPQGALVAITKDNDVALFFEGTSRGLPSVKLTTWVEDVRACPDISRGCAQYLEEKALTPCTVGLAGLRQMMPHYQLKFLTDALNECTIMDADHILRDLRMIKSNREQDQIRRASRIVKGIFDAITDWSFPDMNERNVEAMIYREARRERAEDVRVLIARVGDDKWGLRPTEDMIINAGEGLVICVAVSYERYWSEGIRTYKTREGSLTDPGLDHMEALYGRMISCFRPGNALSQCYEEAMEQIQKSNEDYIEDYGLGRGIGLSLNEWPLIDPEAKEELKEGMCLTLRLTVKDRTGGAVMIGNTLSLSKTGVEVLTV